MGSEISRTVDLRILFDLSRVTCLAIHVQVAPRIQQSNLDRSSELCSLVSTGAK